MHYKWVLGKGGWVRLFGRRSLGMGRSLWIGWDEWKLDYLYTYIYIYIFILNPA